MFKRCAATFAALEADARQEKPAASYKELILYLKAVVNSLPPGLLRRYFYLFEPDPHLFFALEFADGQQFALIKDKIDSVPRPEFIDTAILCPGAEDKGNGEAALDFFHAGTQHAFRRIEDDYKGGYYNNDAVKLVHCFCNQLFISRANEINFYYQCLRYRGVEQEGDGHV
jgi:hypothetical protein